MVSKRSDDTYKTRSRCPLCRVFAIEGEPHSCTVADKSVIHTNPAAPKPEPKDGKA